MKVLVIASMLVLSSAAVAQQASMPAPAQQIDPQLILDSRNWWHAQAAYLDGQVTELKTKLDDASKKIKGLEDEFDAYKTAHPVK